MEYNYKLRKILIVKKFIVTIDTCEMLIKIEI